MSTPGPADSDSLRAPRLPPVYRLIALDSVGSTMDEARRLAEAGAEDGTLVWAREQTKGRGRLGRSWASPRGNLYLSLLLRPDCPPAQAAQLGFVAALALGEAIGSVSPPVDVTYKWPNDVLLHGRKVAGLLLESRSTPEGGLDWLILGMGVNVATFPKEANYPATSLRFEGVPRDVDEVDLLEAFGRYFMSWASRWLEDGFAPVRAAWLRHAERLGQEIEVRLPNQSLAGTFRDLDAEGHLLLGQADGTTRRIAAGEIFPVG
ncbi:BirA family transcriptional regulator, biotin operon repressor / biotin-[acetyl-CoA-carboxylase] ligase [Tistlia consotensis]|uniref:biotin--[biotin carboxyl-carrier protein] ligase n=1 Tax=Tistlia consotensis USBA 355 TaxID=560819 RepID=A0A1Y6BRH0_9PROT|nr:biotin--[acetyl-CoA-carboxylase] ligase [Tistlia consotensis]SMF25168.1 BirA family transcriptional regulator, biotin operon repressor / biotin-[acetyl-CoA-carboxylase] ligase [Tistlia consotensis USBA 355]SNR59920.1 BirA family transcriptional regulator, biotin operon repressor / biotin-[acetyl-CoA-carboxylase] ligase [Tistlia consotensis]